MKELLLTLIAGLFFLIGVVINKINKGSKKVISFSIGMAFSSLILLLITDIIPETWLGAAGCASGSQLWKGTKPALIPKPINPRINAIFASWGFSVKTFA